MNQGPVWDQLMKKNSGQKSRATVPLSEIKAEARFDQRLTSRGGEGKKKEHMLTRE